MEIRLIKTFLAIVKYGSFQEASKVLQYSQPTITVQVKKLEEDLGIQLFKRGKTTELTSAGKFFLQRAEGLLHKFDQFENELQDYKQGDSGIIHIGISEPTASNRFPAVLASLAQKKPNIQVKITVGSNKELVDMLINKQVDIALCNRPEANTQLIFEQLLTETFGLLVYEGHPLAEQDRVSIQDLREEKLVLTPGTCPFRARIEEAIVGKLGRFSHTNLEVPGISSLKYFVQAKLGIALAPIVAISPAIPGTVLKPIEGMIPGPELGILTRRDSSNYTIVQEMLVEEIRTVCSARP